MARTLLATTCNVQADGSYVSQSTYYSPARRAAQQAPLESEYGQPSFTCTAYQIAGGVQLDQYCAVDDQGNGVLRTVYSRAGGSGVVQLLDTTDAQSSLCNGACDLAITYQQAFNTSAPSLLDGRLVIEVNTSHPPVSCYVATLGAPTATYTYPGGITQFDYTGVRPGTYVAAVQDNNNCQLNSDPLTVGKGSSTVGGAVNWFKFQYKDNGQALPQLEGYAWDGAAKHGYATAVNLDIPVWYINTQQYDQGTLVLSSYNGDWRIFRAARNVVAGSKRHQVTQPTDDSMADGDWELVPDGLHARSDELAKIIPAADYHIAAFQPGNVLRPSILGLPAVYGYAQGMVARYRYGGFYRAKVDLTRTVPAGSPPPAIPAPTPGASSASWEYLPGYTDYCYLVPESQAVDTYAYGTAVRRVGYYAQDPANPSYVPQATVAVPAQDAGDYVLLNDTTPDVENGLGDLVLIDVVVNNVDDENAANGSVRIDAYSPSLPLRFHLVNGVRAGYQRDVTDDSTAIYEQLPAGQYQAYVKDAADRQILVEFEITDNYRPRWELAFDDLTRTPAEQGSQLTARIYQRGWTGDVTQVMGGADPVRLKWDSGTEATGALPERLGAQLQLTLRNQVALQFLDTIQEGERFHRIDLYRQSGHALPQLLFRGFIDATYYRESLLGAGQAVEIGATCGLARLADVFFADYAGQRQTARTNLLSIVLKCLSECSLNLPVHCALNLREQLMDADADPLFATWAHRDAYDKQDGKFVLLKDYTDCGAVLDNVLRLFNAQLFQADGAWRIVSLSEVHDLATAVRVWSPAGTRLTGVDTTAPPLRILPPDEATAEREMYWLGASQGVAVYEEAQEAYAVVTVKLDTSLLANGNFALWNVSRPTYWATQGGIAVSKEHAEHANEYAVKFSGYDGHLAAGNYLLSPAAPHLPGTDERIMRLKLRAVVDPATSNPAPSTLTLYVQPVCDGTPYGDPLPVPMSSADKWKDYTLDLPEGMPGTRVRVRLLEPVLDQGAPASTLRLASAYLSIQPSLNDWSDSPTEYEYAENPGVASGISLPDTEVLNADVPRLPALNGTPLDPKGMDIYAWRHALSLADGTATLAWGRPSYPSFTPLLHNIAQDRAAMFSAKVPWYVGDVTGPGVRHLRVGLMLDAPADLTGDGRFYLTDVTLNLRSNTASIRCRQLADGTYAGAVPAVPDHVRAAQVLGRRGYRVSTVNGVLGWRIVQV